MKKRLLLTAGLAAIAAVTTLAQDDVSVTKSGGSYKMDNGIVSVTIGSDGRINNMTITGRPNVIGSSGVYFDYTASSNTGLNPTESRIVKQTADYAEVVYSNTTGDLRFDQGFIMRKGISGVYIYVVAHGTESSHEVNLREARVCTRLNSSFVNGYVDDVMCGKIPTNSEMSVAEREENTIQDATYRMADGSIYTKYNWAQYVVNDSLHGLMNYTTGVWNIPCSHEWLNGGPMRQELTVHATSKSPITIQMIQGEHFGGSAQHYEDGESKIYGPFFIYLNKGTSKEDMIADAKRMATQQQAEWPFAWFEHELYQNERASVRGRLNVTTGQACDSVMLVLAEPGSDPYSQGKGYMFWTLTGKDGSFEIPNVRKGNYTLYGYATKGDVTDELEIEGIEVGDADVNLGTVDWTPVRLERLLWQIGENNRKSDGFRYSDTCRAYGLWELPPADLDYVVGESDEAEDWYYAQTKNGEWTVTFDVDEALAGNALLTASMAGVTNNPTVAIIVNGERQGEWALRQNDAGIYRSAVLGGKHRVETCEFPASLLRQGTNTVTFAMSGIGKNGGVMWDCIKLEAGSRVVSGIVAPGRADAPVELFTVGGQKVGTFKSIDGLDLDRGIYIFRQGGRTGKVAL